MRALNPCKYWDVIFLRNLGNKWRNKVKTSMYLYEDLINIVKCALDSNERTFVIL